MNEEIKRRKQSWIDFANPKSNVTRLLTVDYSESMPARPLLWWENAGERVQWSYERFSRQMEGLTWLNDNTIPYMSMITGTEIFAEAFGCNVHKPLDNNPFALPLVTDVSQLKRVKLPRLEDTKLMILFDMADKLKELGGKDALLSLPDVQTPIDIAALIWEKSDFFAAMYEEPQAVKELAAMVKELLFEFFDKWFARYGKEFIAHYPDYYMPFGITMSEDEIGAVSSDMYKAFFRDELHEFAEHYGAIGIHCCADSKHQWQNLKEIPNLKILNLIRDREETVESLNFFRDVCGQYPAELLTSHEEIDNAESLHLANYISVKTKKAAKEIADYFAEHGILKL